MVTVKGLRANLDLSQADVAKVLGICREAYRKRENGTITFSLEEAVKLAKMFGITIEEFYTATKE